jgi:hypothetical protein
LKVQAIPLFNGDFGGVINAAIFGAIGDDATLNTAAFQAAIDAASRAHTKATYSSGGGTVIVPSGTFRYGPLTWKDGVKLSGQGSLQTVMKLMGATSVGISCAASVTGSYLDQVVFGGFEGIHFISGEAAPTNQVIWDAVGFSRWTVRDCVFEWFGGCNAVRVTGAPLAGNGGPAQWHNEIHNVHFNRLASRPAGGVALNLGDTDINLEQATTWRFYGGRISGAGGGTGVSLRVAGFAFFGMVFEGLDVANDIGGTGTRGASDVSFFGCYYEANVINRRMRPNAARTAHFSAFVTGGADDDQSDTTLIISAASHLFNLGGAGGSQFWELAMASPTQRPKITGTTLPSLDLINSAGSDVTLANGRNTSSSTSMIRVLYDNISKVLFEVGTSVFQPGIDAAMALGTAAKRFTSLHLSGSIFMGGGVAIKIGTGSPEGVEDGTRGTIYLRKDGTAGGCFYVKETDAVKTGWVAK